MSSISALVAALVSFMEHQARTPLSVLRLEFDELGDQGLPPEKLALLNRQIEKMEGIFVAPRSPDLNADTFWELVGDPSNKSWVLRDFYHVLKVVAGENTRMIRRGRTLSFESVDPPCAVADSFSSFTEYLLQAGKSSSSRTLMLDFALLTMGIDLRIECAERLSVIITKL